MKKTLILISSILILTILAVTVSAAGAVATVDNRSCAKGGEVTLDVTVSGSETALSGAVEVIYDKDVLELVKAEWHTDGALLSTFDKATDKGAFAYQTSKSISGKIFSVTFKVRDNAPIGKTDVECIIQLKDGSSDVSVTNNKGSINVTCKHNFSVKSNEFLASEASCTSPATYYYACSICGEKGMTTYTVGSALPHTFDKKVATSTYLVKNVTCVDEAEYYYSCSCGAKGSDKFTADASWSHDFSNDWFISADGHWHQCLDCGAKKDNAEHTPNGNNVCDKCQFVLSNDGTHYHSFGDAWVSNDDAHWHECSCGLKNDMELHNWDAGKETKPATENNEGEMLFTCTDCGRTKTETIEKLQNEEEDPLVTTPAPISKLKLVIIAGAGAMALLAVEAIAFVIYRSVSKRRKAAEVTDNTPEATEQDAEGEQN